MLIIWSLVPLPFLNSACISGKFLVHILLKPNLKDFEHNLVSMWNEHSCMIVETFFGIALFLWLEWKLTFSSPVVTAEFSKFVYILSVTLSQHHLLRFKIAQLELLHYTHSSVLAWRIPGMGEPGGLPSMGSHRVRHDRSDLAAAAVYAPGLTRRMFFP